MNRIVLLSTPVLLLVAQGIAYGDLITSAASIQSPSTTIDFSQFAGANTLNTTGPVQVGSLAGVDVTFQSTNPDGSILGSGPYSFADNGTWDATQAFAGLDVDLTGFDGYTMTFLFNSGPVSEVGGFLNYSVFDESGFGDVVISALASDDSILESWDLTTAAPISTPGALNDGAFRGISRSQADIFGFSLSNSAVAITGLTFTSPVPSSTPIPEPGSIGAVLGALLSVLAYNRRPAGLRRDGENR